MRTLTIFRAFVLALLLGPAIAIAEQVLIIRDTQLRERPRADSPPVANVTQGMKGIANGKEGLWFRISADGNTGWLLMTNFTFLRQASVPHFNPFSSARMRSTAAATIGIIFCYAHETIPTHQISESQLMLLDSYAVPKNDAMRPDELLPEISTLRGHH